MQERPTADAPVPAEVARDIEQIRRELGGSAVERFESLRDPLRPRRGPQRKDRPRPSPQTERRIVVLRRAAQELDLAANRVEEIDAYSEADRIRAAAQRLRRMARRLAGVEEAAAARTNPVAPILPAEGAEPAGPAIAPESD